MKTKLLPVGTLVVAIQNVGPVRQGQPGVVTGIVEQRFWFRKRPCYLCTFFGNLPVAMRPSEVDDFDHGFSREQLEAPFNPTLSVAEQMKKIRLLK
ncbi:MULTISPECIES: hypothetical protein [unclassified Paraburkholderia]|uniref:hypothetical protein n=1 Tax=unclassified Paraburkholderia TaxID=2615204 RepID=UPI0016111353|nr:MULTISPECIES: hypothetical protein [unclassified Paraburkholderia]MBB5446461.1 hypothetical protein [Paraburkholderia sp. WSM4177]MBB5486957.1 hypothetical protein [Paraburkholderia sp. WSM4180]